MPLEPQPAYRAVVLRRHKPSAPDHWDRTVHTYTDAEGTEYRYHRGNAYGPYSTPGAAQASATRESNEFLGNWGGEHIAEIDAFVEETSSVWSLRKKPLAP